MHSPSVSVVMPVYNTERFVADAIDSILAQTYKDFEFLIIDDCSTDGSLSAVKRFTDPRIRLLSNDRNSGLPACENIGLEEAKGKYVVRMDSDDLSTPDRIEKLYRFMEANSEVDVCGSWLKYFGDRDGVLKYHSRHEDIAAELIWICSLPHAACIFRTDQLREKKLFYDESFSVGEDWVFLLQAHQKGLRFACIPEVLYHYRRGGQSMVVQAKSNLWDHNSRVYRALLNDLGLSPDDTQLKHHAFLLAKFDLLAPGKKVIKEAAAWMRQLISMNDRSRKYDPAAFERACRDKWDHLFYKLVPFGYSSVSQYFAEPGSFSFGKLMYFIKYSFNKSIARS